MKRTIYMLIGVLALLSVAGCNTMAGFGKDVEAAGEAVQRGAKK